MAESVQEDNSWLGGWIKAAKDTSSTAYEFMKKDLSEFSSVIQQDSARAAGAIRDSLTQENANVAKDRVRQGMTSILDGITKVLVIEPESDGEDEKITKDGPIFDRSKARLHAIQIDPGTYMNGPPKDDTDFVIWLETFVLENHKGDISELLVANAEVRGLYTQLVPAHVSHDNFWNHYFYRIHQFTADEQRRADLKKRADMVTSCDEDTLQWADDWVDFEDVCKVEEKPEEKPEDQQKGDNHINQDLKSLITNRGEDVQPSNEDTQQPVNHSNQENEPSTDNIPELLTTPGDESLSDTVSSPVDFKSAYSLTVIEPSPTNDSKTECDNKEEKPSPTCVEKGDLVVIGPNDSISTSDCKGSSSNSLDEEWEKDFDVTEEDILAAQQEAQNIDLDDEKSDDWESWE